MDSVRHLFSLLCLLAGTCVCLSQQSMHDTARLDSTAVTPVVPQGFEARQKVLAGLLKTIEEKKYDEAIAQADKVVLEATSTQDTVNMRDAYRILSKAYHGKEDFKQRDLIEQRIQSLAIAYGYHLDEGLDFLARKEIHADILPWIFDELQLLEDKEGTLSFEEISSATFQGKFTSNFTVAPGDALYKIRESSIEDAQRKVLFNQDAVYWVKVKLTGSKTKKDNYLIHIGRNWGGSWDKVDMYVQSSTNAVEHFRLGLALSLGEKDFKYNQNYFEVPLDKNEVKTLYLRLEGARKNNGSGWYPDHVCLAVADTRLFYEFDGYYHIPDSITHTHEWSQPRRLNHVLHSLNFIEDPEQKYSLNEVVQNWDQLDPQFPYQMIPKSPSAYYWARFNVVNTAKNITTHSFMLPEQWDDVEVYVPDTSGNYHKLITGSNIPEDKKAVKGLYNIFRIQAHYNDTLTIFMKFKSNRVFPYSSTGFTKFEIAHFDESQLWYSHYKQYLPHYIMIGMLLMQMLYYFIIFLINKERTHLYLMFFFLGAFLTTLNNSNIIHQFQSNQAILFFGGSISILGLFKYTETFLSIHSMLPWVRKVNRYTFIALLLSLLTFVGVLFYNYFFKPVVASDAQPAFLNINMYIILAVMFILLVQAIYGVIKRVKNATSFLLFYILILISGFASSMFTDLGIDLDQSTALSYVFFTLSTLGLMLITAYYLKQLRKDQGEKEKAQASERAKHQFLANMSHEIRTPMNAIKGMTDILIRRDPKDDQKEYLDSIKQSSDSLLVIINDILDISKIEAGKIELEHEPFSLMELINNVHTIMQFKAEEKGLQLKKDIPTEDLYVKGDATRLRQILINLIGNAIKFTEKGLVTTALQAEKVNGKLNLHFVISDTGIGIDKDRMDKIFKSFEQAYSDTSRKFGGSGLGLSISKMLVELQQGKIWVESEKGKGSQFHFTIAYDIAEPIHTGTKTEDPDINIAAALKGIRILLVEDNPFNMVVAQEELEDAIEGVYVEVAENGAIAVEKLRSSSYDIILMDVQMPTMNGYEATIAIRAFNNEKAGIPIIAMTANVLKDEVDLCYQAGMNDFIGKPFDTLELLHKINLLIKK
jgi:signal transduction histidine kinase